MKSLVRQKIEGKKKEFAKYKYTYALIAISSHSYPAGVMGRVCSVVALFEGGGGRGGGWKTRESSRGSERERERERPREFNSMVDYATSLPDYCRYTLPFCADEGDYTPCVEVLCACVSPPPIKRHRISFILLCKLTCLVAFAFRGMHESWDWKITRHG